MKERTAVIKSRERLLSLVLPFIVGFGGLFITQEIITSELMKYIAGAISIVIPPFFTILFLSKYHTTFIERVFLVLGIILLVSAGFWVLTGTTLNPYWYESLPEGIRRISEMIGIGSFLLGMLMFAIILVCRSENIEEIAERFKVLTEHISEGFVLSSPDGTIVDVNEQFCRFLSVSKKEIIGMSVLEMARKYNVQEIGRKWLTRGYGISGEYEIEIDINQQRKYFWIHGTPIFDRKGRHKAILATVKDITELKVLSEKVRKHAEELEKIAEEKTRKLRESEENLRQLILTMNEGFVLLDSQHKIIMVNDCFCSMLNSEREQIIGKSIYELLDKINLVKLLSILDASGVERRKEVNFLCCGYKEVPTLVSVSIIPADNENEYKYSLVISDLRQQKKMQNELEERTKQLEKLNEELRQYGKNKDAFLSNVSHELRTPISTIQGYIEMLLSSSLGPLTPNQEHSIKTMQRNTQRLLRMVNEMIEFSRMEIKGLQIRKKLFSINELMEENISFIRPKVIAKQLELKWLNGDNDIYVWADREKISQVIGILLNNAVKFTEISGCVEISANIREGTTLEISVSDTGIGIPPEFHEKIFEKFFQVDSSPTRKYEGTGIGLAVAKGIVDAHHGKIEVYSVPGKGSKFTVILPDSIFNVMEEIKGEQITNKIILVDNETALYNALSSIDVKIQSKMERVKNIYELTRMVTEKQPDLILINTYEQEAEPILSLVHKIEEEYVFEGIDIIILIDETIKISTDYVRHINEKICFLEKPFSAKSLIELINRISSGERVETLSLPEKTDHKKERLILVYEPENMLREFINWALSDNGENCIFLEKYIDIVTWIEKFKPYAIIIDLDDLTKEEKDKLHDLEEKNGFKLIYILSGNNLRFEDSPYQLKGKILNKPFLIGMLMELLKKENTEEITTSKN